VSLIGLIITLVVLGLILYLINQFVPMDQKIKTILNVAVVIIVILWLIQSFGLLGPLGDIKIR
jgi:hypothetical protein